MSMEDEEISQEDHEAGEGDNGKPRHRLMSSKPEKPVVKRKRGRPPLSKEEKEERARQRAERKGPKKRKKKRKRSGSVDNELMDRPDSPDGHQEDELTVPHSFACPRGLVKATPAFFFFLNDNRFKIERVLARKHRYFNRLPKGMERNELIAREAALWWVKLRPSDHRRYLNMSMRDFEERVVEWKEEKNIQEMVVAKDVADAIEDTDIRHDGADLSPEDELLTYRRHKKLYLDTSVGSKPFAPEPGKSSNRVLLELLQDMRFHPLPMLSANRGDSEPGQPDYSKLAIPFFEVHGPVSTSLGDECLGCSRGWNHFCPVLKRNIPAIENRAKLQPPLSSLMATRVGLGLRPRVPASNSKEGTSADTSREADLFSMRDTTEAIEQKKLPPIPSNSLSHPSSRADDIALFVEEATMMKVPEPPRPAAPWLGGESAKRSALSRGALPVRAHKKRDAHDTTAFEGGEHGQAEVLSKCGRCRSVTQSETGCFQCRRAQLVINTSKRMAAEAAGSGRKSESKGEQGALKVRTTMLGRLSAKDTNFDKQLEGDKAISNAMTRIRWAPNAVLPPQKFLAPTVRSSSSDDSGSTSSGTDDSTSSDEEEGADVVDISMEDVSQQKDDTDESKGLAGMEETTILEESDVKVSSSESDGHDETAEGRASRRQRSARRVAASSTAGPSETDRQQVAKEHQEEANALSRRCVTVASCGILLAMMRRDPLLLFAEPVPSDTEAYSKIVPNPIDFGKIRSKVLGEEYSTLGAFISDARRLCTNALAYNPAGTIYSKTAKELYDVLEIMHKRASDWMLAIKNAHASSFAWRGPESQTGDLLFDRDGEGSGDDPFKELRKTWPEAVEILESGDTLRDQLAADFMRTKENEVAYYGSLAIRRAAAAAEASLAPYPDSGGAYNPVVRRDHIQDEALRNLIDARVANLTKPVELKDIPTWREEAVMRILRRVQSRRVEGRISSENGCARCDGVRIEQEAKMATRAESVRWGRNKRRGEINTLPRVAASRLSLSTGQGSTKNCDIMEKQKAEAKDSEEFAEEVGDVGVSVQGSAIHGWGLFADQPFKPGDVVAEYVGEYVTHEVADVREKMYQERRIQDYQFRTDESVVIDATLKGGLGRYINHNCSPNCIAKIVEGPPPNQHLKRVIIIAQRNIKIREEITYDYQFPLELDLDARIPCNCGSSQCRGFMNWDLPEKGSKNRVARPQRRGGNMRDRIRRLGRPRKRGEHE